MNNNTNASQPVGFPGVKDGEVFTVAGMEFIKFPGKNGQTPVVMKDIAFRSRFGDNNNLKESEVLKRLESDILPNVIAAIGEENLCTVRTDLTTLDGLKPYGVMESFISLPTLDFYREHVEIFDKYNPDTWWWLATPESARPHEDPYWILCVSPSGGIFYYFSCNSSFGVRPFLIFNSSIFESTDNGAVRDDNPGDHLLLQAFGYELSDEEQQLKNGTHPLFVKDPDPVSETATEEVV